MVVVSVDSVAVVEEGEGLFFIPLGRFSSWADFSPHGLTLVAHEPTAPYQPYEDATYVSVSTREAQYFDLDPEDVRGAMDDMGFVQGRMVCLPLDGGGVFCGFSEGFRIYDEQLRSATDVSLRPSTSASTWTAAPSGLLFSRRPEYGHLQVVSRTGEVVFDRSLGVPAMVHWEEMLAIKLMPDSALECWDLSEDELVWKAFENHNTAAFFTFDQDSPYVTVRTGGERSEERVHSVVDIRDATELYSYGGFEEGYSPLLGSVSGNGHSLVRLYDNSSAPVRFRYILLDEAGQLIWCSPVRLHSSRCRFDDTASSSKMAISDDGMRVIYSDGYFITVLTLEEE